MAAELPEFDPQIIERHVEGLLRKSSAFIIGSVVLGVFLGAAFGATPLTSLGASWPIPRTFGFATLLLGGICGGIVGYVVGDTRSFMYKLQAQIALAQVKAARDAESVLNLLQAVAKVAPKLPAPVDAPPVAVRARVQPPATEPAAPAAVPEPPLAPPPAVSEPEQQAIPEDVPALREPDAPPPRVAAVRETPLAPPLSPPVSR